MIAIPREESFLPFNFPLKNSFEFKTLSSSGALRNGWLSCYCIKAALDSSVVKDGESSVTDFSLNRGKTCSFAAQ